ncbi:gamma-glutamyltransferase family protein [Bradyrhizobium sp. URHD0069]|uniref:gamma-glutamyltransferase family protein n=1 Tax=Bradyrhizobium sp. URHD0069 TaxID=1380355 RepID=UPI000496555B|nr:gamma-glutamyltransferase family protein [Bradyrhizobium sp. URHD0069]
MLNTSRAHRGMVTSPHHLASEAGARVLREGGNAIEATVAMAAALAVVYPHMTSIGGDGFWIINVPNSTNPISIEACGGAAHAASPALYAARGLMEIPWRGPLAANTVAGTLSGWSNALELSAELGGRVPLSRLTEDAVWHAEHGFAVTASQAELTQLKCAELRDTPGFSATFLIDGGPPREGALMKFPAMGRTLRRLGESGLDDFYRGDLAREIAADLERLGSPVGQQDLAQHSARRRACLSVGVRGATLYNFAPPTQGLASLMILALFERLGVTEPESFAHIHGLVEATKQAFLVRDLVVGDPDVMTMTAEQFLDDSRLDRLASRIDRDHALAWPAPASAGDTVWLGAIDGSGLAVSFIQSIYFEFGSGCVLPGSGIVWQNRGTTFQLEGTGPRVIAPGRKPFHTLNPALARFDDGRVMVYGTMGGDGQPQTQSAIYSRYGFFGQGLQSALTAPRWLLGKTWGESSVTLKLESRFDPAVVSALRAAGHDVEILPAFTSTMGHAGAIVRHPNGLLEGASDPRSDGAAIGF